MVKVSAELRETFLKIGYVMIDRKARTPDEIKFGGAGVTKDKILEHMPSFVKDNFYSFDERTGRYRIEKLGIEEFEKLKRRPESVAAGRLIT